MDEVRVSIDAGDPAGGEELTRRRGAWEAAVATLKGIAAMREAGLPVFLIANTVVGRRNRRDLAEIVSFLLSCRPDDIKLITEVQEKDRLSDFPEVSEVVSKIESTLAAYPADAFPLLRRKLGTVFTPEAIGLGDVKALALQDWRCYIPLTERTVDRVYYYPCSVYLREGGAPLGHISESAEVQRGKSAAFARRHDCLSDPICHRYCLNCTKLYNASANRARLSCV